MIRFGAQLARLLPRGRKSAEQSNTLCLSISELGWWLTLLYADGQPPTTSEGRIPLDAGFDTVEVLRRAVRTITAAQREQIGQVKLLVDDPAIYFADNRALRIRTDDTTAIRQVGAQELGTAGAIYAFQAFGASSEHEVQRGAYAFLSTQRVQDYLGALDSLALKLVELLPARLVRLVTLGDRPFALVDIRGTATTVLLADPQTGLICLREEPIGVHRFAVAIAERTSISIADAFSGLERRACFAANAGSADAPAPITATEKALAPLLTSLREQLLGSLDYFVFQRLAGAPERLLVSGEADRVRGLVSWLGGVMELTPEPAPDLDAAFAVGLPRSSCNLLQTMPKGLLKIGKVEYRFVNGRFVPENAQKKATSTAKRPLPPWAEKLRERLRDAAVPLYAAAIVLVGSATVALTAAGQSDSLVHAHDAWAAALVEDGIIRSALAKRVTEAPQERPLAAYWTEKLAAIASAMPPRLRLTRLTTAASGGRDNKLLLEGQASSRGDALGEVMTLIRRLNENAEFMRDVASVSFDGTSADRAATDPVNAAIRFVVTVTLKTGDKGGS